MHTELQRIFISSIPPLLLLFILYAIKILEIGLHTEFIMWGIYPLSAKGIIGIFTAPLVHANFAHLLANTIPLLILSWMLHYFYRELSYIILAIIWVGSGAITFLIGKSAWHIGASGIIYGLAFFLFFSGILRKHRPLIAVSFLVTFLYGGLVWQAMPYFTPPSTSWEGHLSGAITGIICAFCFIEYGPQKPHYIEDEDEIIPYDYSGKTEAILQEFPKDETSDATLNAANKRKEVTTKASSDLNTIQNMDARYGREDVPH